MKWGVRRYQNADGSLTAEGKKHYSNSGKNESAWFKQTVKVKDKSPISPAEKVVSDAKKTVDETSNALNSAYRIKTRYEKPSNNVKEMSDKELREAINRLNMEKQYNDLTRSDTAKGFDTAMDILSITGNVLAASASIVSIYAILKRM